MSDGRICETSNFDSSEICTNCGEARQNSSPEFQPQSGTDLHDFGEKLRSGVQAAAKIGAEKAREYAPAAGELARQARQKASEVAQQSRLATRTGVHPFTVFAFCTILLITAISLPVALGWPLQLVISDRFDRNEAVNPAEGHLLAGASQSIHEYTGTEYSAQYRVRELSGPRKTALTMATLLSGPILITGTPVTLSGVGVGAEGEAVRGSVTLRLTQRHVFWICAGALILLLLITDKLIGDIYAMQKLLITLVIVWTGYCFLIGMAAQYVIKDVATELFPQNLNIGLTPSGLLTAPIKLAFIGLIYWMSSMLMRNIRLAQVSNRAVKTAN